MHPVFTPEALVEHVDFLRALARRLVRDEHAAEDLVQDAVERGIEARDVPVRGARAWLSGVLRHRAADLHRERRRRTLHEAAAARPDRGEPDPARMQAQLEVQRALARAVAELSEPSRSVVFPRYYEGLAPRAIAQRLGVPVETVKTRLRRGLEQLRVRLDAEHDGERERWCCALAGLVELPRPAVSASTLPATTVLSVAGGLLNAKLMLTGAALLLALGGWMWLRPGEERAPLAIQPEAESSPSSLVERGRSDARDPAGLEALALAQDASRTSVARLRGWHIVGRVTDEGGAGVPGAEVHIERFVTTDLFRSSEPAALTADANGDFEHVLELEADISAHVRWNVRTSAQTSDGRSGSSALVTLDPRRLAHGGTVRLDVRVAHEPRDFPSAFGRVVDADGLPLGGVPITFRCADGVLPAGVATGAQGRFDAALDLESGANGAAVRGPVRVVAGSELSGTVESGPIELSGTSRVDVGTLVLNEAGFLEGRVHFPDGRPVEGLTLAVVPATHTEAYYWPKRTAVTDPRGGFRFEHLLPGEYGLRAPDHWIDQRPLDFGTFDTAEVASLSLPLHRLTVRVCDEEGLIVPGVFVQLEGEAEHYAAYTSGPDATAVFCVRPGTYCLIASLAHSGEDWMAPSSPDAVWVAREIVVEGGRYDERIELELDFEPERGALRVVATDERGVPVEGGHWLVVRLPGRRESLMSFRADASGRVAGVLPGDYELEVYAPPSHEADRQHFAAQAEAHVRANEESEVAVVFTRGGRIELELAPLERLDVPVRWELESLVDGARTELGIWYHRAPEGRWRVSRPSFGTTGLSVLLPPGPHRLHVHADGCRSVAQHVDIRAGEFSKVTLALERE